MNPRVISSPVIVLVLICSIKSPLFADSPHHLVKRQSHHHSHERSGSEHHGHGGLHLGHGQDHHHWYEVHRTSSSWATSPIIRVFLWPNLTPHEKQVLRMAFEEFRRKTCVTFREEDWVPWYHWKRWEKNTPYVIIRKSKHLHRQRGGVLAESRLQLDDKVNRTLMYLSEKALNRHDFALSRGIALHELGHVIGMVHEHQRPDAWQYIHIKSTSDLARDTTQHDHGSVPPVILTYPFDPMSVTIYAPSEAEDFRYTLTSRCSNVRIDQIGRGKQLGRLTFWDAIKVNALYCPEQVNQRAVVARPPPCQGERR